MPPTTKERYNSLWQKICESLASGKLDYDAARHLVNFDTLANAIAEITDHYNVYAGYLQSNERKDFVKLKYLNEIWLSEITPPADSGINTQELVKYIKTQERDTFQAELKRMARGYAKEVDWWLIINNLWNALDLIFGDEEQKIDENFCNMLHFRIMDGLINSPGNFRKNSGQHIYASGSNVSYCDPSKVAKRMSVLLEFYNEQVLGIGNEECFKAICLGAFFFSEFLLIHPFMDGNGRTARLLLSVILKKWTVVPVSLYFGSNRNTYLEALYKRGSGTIVPWTVIQYVTFCARETVGSLCIEME